MQPILKKESIPISTHFTRQKWNAFALFSDEKWKFLENLFLSLCFC